MYQLPYDKIIEKIKEKTGLSQEDVEAKIKAKMEELSGLISKEGAAHIIANENSVKVFEESSRELKIRNILGGMRNVSTVGKVLNVYSVTEFDKGDFKGKVGSFLMGDDTGLIRVVLWNDQADQINEVKEGCVVKLENVYAKENNFRKELHLNSESKMTINPVGIVLDNVVEKQQFERKTIAVLSDVENNVELLGVVVQAFDMRYFEVCPDCNKRMRQGNERWVCEEHGEKDPKLSYVLNVILDDGTDSMRLVLWSRSVQALTGLDDEKLQQYNADKEGFEVLKKQLLGKIVRVVGRVQKNTMFERKEFVANMVFEANAEEELKRSE
jgi:ssDNA-binding replication factor A large subunit